MDQHITVSIDHQKKKNNTSEKTYVQPIKLKTLSSKKVEASAAANPTMSHKKKVIRGAAIIAIAAAV